MPRWETRNTTGLDIDYEFLDNKWSFFMYSFRAAIGDLEVPNASVWLEISNSKAMIYVIWILWMIEIYFMLIVFLNFLIAIISQVYEEDYEKGP